MYVNWKVYACMGLNFSNSNRIYYLLDTILGAKHNLLNPLNCLTTNKQYSSDFFSVCNDVSNGITSINEKILFSTV